MCADVRNAARCGSVAEHESWQTRCNSIDKGASNLETIAGKKEAHMKRIGETSMLWEGFRVVVRDILCLALGAYGFFEVADLLLFCR